MVKTLIVDDDKIICFFHKKIITNSNIDTSPETFLKAELALEYLDKKLPEENHILILLDINMKGMDGWEFLERLKALDFNQKCDVVVVSSSISHADKQKASQTGYVADFFEKPLIIKHCEELKKLESIKSFFY